MRDVSLKTGTKSAGEELTAEQQQVLDLLGLPTSAYTQQA